jgi:hypothetical protein
MYSLLSANVGWIGLISFALISALESSNSGPLVTQRVLGDNALVKLGEYSIKFQGCHRVAQWKYEEKSNSHVYFHYLARFRLCSESYCSNNTASGCSSHYGEYLLDISTFLYYYFMIETTNYDTNVMIKPSDYTSCTAFKNFVGYSADNTDEYYVGPYCSKQGGAISLGLFTDNVCSLLSKCDNDCFKEIMGYNLQQSSLITRSCISCSSSSTQTYYGPRYECKQIYKQSGKCESKMNVQNPNLSECKYIAGVKSTGQDGILRSNAGRGKVTALITFLAACCSIIGLYIFYLRRSKS